MPATDGDGDRSPKSGDRADAVAPAPEEPAVPKEPPGNPPKEPPADKAREEPKPRTRERARGRPSDADDMPPDGADDARHGQQVVNNIYGGILGGSVSLGITSTSVSRRRTGVLTADEVDEALRCYVQPSCFKEALEALDTRRLVVLTGPEGIGKRAGAIALLQHAGAITLLQRHEYREVVGMSPVISVGELAGYKFRGGRGYLVQDRQPDTGQSAQLQFDVQEVVRRLTRSEAYLVVTVTGSAQEAAALRGFAVTWRCPDPAELLDRCLSAQDVPVADDERHRLLEIVRDHPAPARVVNLVEQARDHGVQAALEAITTSDRDAVCAWFDEQPPRERVLFVAALAFVHALPERLFERALAVLEEGFEAEERPEGGDGDDGRRTARPLDQVRQNRLSQIGLVDVTTRADAAAGVTAPERRLVFKTPGYRRLVIEELWNRYDRQLWDPVSDWLRAVALSWSVEARVQAALGLALLGGTAGYGTLASFTEPWSRGTWSERLMAAYTLWWSCLDDALAPLALRSALDWSHSGDPRRLLTAAVTLSGEVGVRYVGEARRALWRLAMRDDGVGAAARQSIAELFCALTIGPGNGVAVLNFLRDHGVRLTGKRFDTVKLNRLADTTARILDATVPETDEPIVASFLVASPDQLDALGWLWAAALRDRTVRAVALRSLVKVLRSLGQHPDHEATIAALGDTIGAALPAEEQALLARDLRAAVAEPEAHGRAGDKQDRSRALVEALLDALQHRSEPRGGDDHD